jgi:putative transposase
VARSIRIEYAGAYYHVMARGNRRAPIYLDDDDRRFFLKTLSEACERTGWKVHAWELMGNHYHLFVETPEPNLVEGMKWLQNTVTRRFNTRHGEWGRLFGDRYKAVLVDGEKAHYYTTLWEYIHLNPGRAGVIKVGEGGSILDYPWSSLAGGYALLPTRRPKWLAADRGLAIMGYPDTVKGRREMVKHLDERIAGEGKRSGMVEEKPGLDRRMSHLRRGWYWGGQEFAERMLKIAASSKPRRSRAYRSSPERLAHGEVEARRLLVGGVKAAGFAPGEMQTLAATDARKVALAALLWKRTTVSQGWIAHELAMKSAANVSLLLHRVDQRKLSRRLPVELRAFLAKMKEDAH